MDCWQNAYVRMHASFLFLGLVGRCYPLERLHPPLTFLLQALDLLLTYSTSIDLYYARRLNRSDIESAQSLNFVLKRLLSVSLRNGSVAIIVQILSILLFFYTRAG